MGLDMVNLQVLSTSGSEKEKKHALKVIKLLEKGRHWVLVVLLLGNVIGELKLQAEVLWAAKRRNGRGKRGSAGVHGC